MHRVARQFAWFVVDALTLAVVLGASYLLAFDFEIAPGYPDQLRAVLGPVVALEVGLLWALGLYRRMTRFAGLGELITIATALSIALALGLIHFFAMKALGFTPSNREIGPALWPIPRSVLVLNWLAGMGAVGGSRLLRRQTLDWPVGPVPLNAKRALIIGATDVGDFAVRMIRRTPSLNLRPVAFVDEHAAHVGRTIQGVPIAGTLADMDRVIHHHRIAEALIALPDADKETINRILEICRRHRVQIRALPSQAELIAGRRELGTLRAVDVEELLGREALDQRLPDEDNYIADKTVLITGAGGSIGSELCRQIYALGPRKMVMIGRGENSLFELMQSLGHPGERLFYHVSDVRDEPKMRLLLDVHRPQIVFHAAAHKHVPLMEDSPDEAVKNNILGTALLARLADEFQCERFVLISTDKAVRPSSVMGASKRVAELIVLAWAARSATRFIAVRFGNVLGSRGSVIPLFRRQIEQGGPVTVTHPKAERYFMTIKEAVTLVLRAGTVAEPGHLCVLDMGELVNIDEMARNLITLSGLEPGKDIEIKYVGLRPGEKLREEYLSAQEGLEKTEVGKVFVTRPGSIPLDELQGHIDRLRRAAERADGETIRAILLELIPDYHIPSESN